MNRIQRAILKAVAGEDAVKALQRPTWWNDVWNTSALGEGGTFANTPAGWRGAVNSNVWAYNCVKARMSLVAQAPLKLYKGVGPDREEVDDHPVLELLQEVNTVNLNKRSFMRGIEQQLSIYGRCIVHKNRAAKVHELFILPMEYIEPIPDERLWLAGYRWLPTGDVIPREDVVDFFYSSANGSVYADSPAAVAANSINRYNLADKSQAAIDKRGGQKGGIVVHAKDEIQEDYYRIRDEWDRKRSDPEQAGRDLHVPYGTDWRGDAFSATEMQREERNQRLAKEIMAAFSVPPAAAGDYRDASVLANAATQMSAFWNMWGVDELKFIAEELTYSLLWAEWKDTRNAGMYFEHDLSDIQALREDADALANRAIVLYQGAVVSLNEARELAGFDRADDPAADQIPVPEQPAPADVQSTDTTATEPAPADMAAMDMAATPPADATVQQLALNGAQISSLVEVVQAVSNNELSTASAIEIIRVSFPAIDEGTIVAMIDAAAPSPMEAEANADQAEVDSLSTEVDSLLSEIDGTANDTPPAKALGRPEKGDRDGDGIFNEGSNQAGGAKVSPVTGRSLKPEGPSAEEKKAAKDKERAQKKAAKDKEREQKKAETAKLREQKKAEAQKVKEQKAAAKKQAQVDQLDAEYKKLDDAYNSIKDRTDVDPKLKQKVIDTMAKVQAKRNSILFGQSEATSGVLQDVARLPAKAFMPVVDFVGMTAVDNAGGELGTIEKIHRFGTFDGIEATKAVPVVIIAGKAYSADDVNVVVEYGEETDDHSA